jgi:hypothetical protein
MSLDLMLPLGAAAVELGIPVGCLWAWTRRPSWRPALAVLLGAATPWVLLYAAVACTWLTHPSKENLWAVLAMWIMSFLFYVCNLGVATVLAGFQAPRRLAWRAAMGAVPALAVGAVAAVTTFGRW